MNVLTWDGYDINDGTDYITGLTSPILGNAGVQANLVERHGRYPLIGGVSWPGDSILLTTIIESATAQKRATLRTIFETESGEIKTLIIEGDDGTEQYVQALCEAHYEEDEVGNTFYSVLRVHDDPAWRSTAVQTNTESITATAQEWEIENEGDQVARPTITITPRTRTADTNFYRRFVAVRWRVDNPATNYPTDIMDDAWDTAALVADTTNSVQLNGAINNSVTTIPYDTVVGSFPSSGMGYVDTEQFTYTGRTGTTSGNLTGVTRGVNGTSAASHSDNAVVKSSKTQANGDDVRIRVNGLEVDYWLDDMNTNNTSVWVNLDYQPTTFMTLASPIASSGAVETIDVNEAITNMPPQGVLLIDDELFIYTAKNDTLRRFTVLAREAHGTSMAAHIVTDDVYWIQHDIEVHYGSSTMPAYDTDDSLLPVIALATSSNTIWDYDDFGGASGGPGGPRFPPPRAGAWQHTDQYYWAPAAAWIYTWYNESQYPSGPPSGNPDTVQPWEVMGLMMYQYFPPTAGVVQRWKLYCPCLIDNMNFQNGFKLAAVTPSQWRGEVRVSQLGINWTLEYDIPVPSIANTWESWSYNAAPASMNDATYVSLELYPLLIGEGGIGMLVEAGDVTITFDSTFTPTSYLAPERGNFTIYATLTHVESGLALSINYTTSVDNSLIINTDTGEITDESDGSSQFQAVRRLPRPRVEWLPLQPGTNTLRWDENSGVEVPIDIDVTFEWRERRGA